MLIQTELGTFTQDESGLWHYAQTVSTEIGLIDLATFRVNLFDGKVSFHPNDNIYHRWGITRGNKTRCEQYYGYPEL